jgi:hypothetical protein
LALQVSSAASGRPAPIGVGVFGPTAMSHAVSNKIIAMTDKFFIGTYSIFRCLGRIPCKECVNGADHDPLFLSIIK